MQWKVRFLVVGGVLIFLIILLLGCAYPYGRMNYEPLPMENLSLGMSKIQVKEALGRPPSSVIGSRFEGDHLVEVWHYMQAYFNWYGGADHIQYQYYLYFLDDKLVQWGRPGDWESEADRILEVRFR